MRSKAFSGRRLSTFGWMSLTFAVATACGCHSSELSKADEATMRVNMTRKGPVNINDLPADQRQKIQEFFRKQGGMPGQTSSPPPKQAGQ